MKKGLLALGLVICMAAPATAGGGDVKVSGAVEVHYRRSSDLYAGKGDDKIQPEELYIQVSKEVADNVETLIKLDGADMNNKTGSSSTHKVIEEAQVIFKNVGNQPLILIFGKDEMPFGQDYEKFLLSSRTHGFEIDKVWGVHGIYKIEGLGSIAAALFERAPEYDNTLGVQEYVDPDTGLTDSFTAKITLDKMVDNLSVEASYASTGRDEAVGTEVDEDRFSVGAKFNLADLTIHGEYTSFSDYKHAANSDLEVIQVGADYKIGNWLLKVRHEMSDDDVDNNNDEENRTAVGISYYFNKNALLTAELEKITYDGTKDDVSQTLIGAAVKF